VAALPRLVDQYAAEEPYRRTVDRICEVESDCDGANRRLGTLLSNAAVEDLGLRLTHVHLNAGATIDLYRRLDDVADAEQFAQELAAIEPPRSVACLDLLREMAEVARRTVPVLAGVLTDYVESLCDPYESATIGEGIARVRRAESECDDLRNEVIATAFAGDVPVPMVYREFAHLLDAVVDAMEDVADRIVRTTGSESWVEVDLAGKR